MQVYREEFIEDSFFSLEEFVQLTKDIQEKYKDKNNVEIHINSKEYSEYGEIYSEGYILITWNEEESGEEQTKRLEEFKKREEEDIIKGEMIKKKIPIFTETIQLYREGRII